MNWNTFLLGVLLGFGIGIFIAAILHEYNCFYKKVYEALENGDGSNV